MIRHGDFISVYGNLNDVFVQKGDKIKVKQSVGTVNVVDGRSELKFQLRQNFEILNPEYWLFKAS